MLNSAAFTLVVRATGFTLFTFCALRFIGAMMGRSESPINWFILSAFEFEGIKQARNNSNIASPTVIFMRAWYPIFKEIDNNFPEWRKGRVMNLSEYFAKSVFEHQSKEENWVYSPYSLTAAMGMSYLGASGVSVKEMEMILQFSEENLPPVLPEARMEILLSANQMFLSSAFTVKDEFSRKLETHFQSRTEQVDFTKQEESSQKINQWVSEQTKEKIVDLVSPMDIDPDFTRLVLVNALYFIGQWKIPFEKERTRKEVFYKKGGQEQMIEMMIRTFKLQARRFDDYTVVALPYRDDVSFFIVLPIEKDGWRTISMEYWEQNFDFIQRSGQTKTKLTLPRFSLKASYDMSEILKKIGLETVFSETEADFSRISDEPLKIDKVLHQANISIDEDGSEASAATAVIINRPRGGRVRPEMPFEVTIDHPFFFVLRHNQTKEWLFVGQYLGE